MKRGIVTYVALVLIVIIIISAVIGAFYWITKIQGDLQAGTQRYNKELTGKITKQLDIISFDYNSSNDNATVIVRNIGTKDLEDIGSKEDKIIITSKTSSCDMWFNGSSCNVCPFDLNVNKLENIKLNVSGTECAGLSKGTLYSSHFALSELSAYASFTAG